MGQGHSASGEVHRSGGVRSRSVRCRTQDPGQADRRLPPSVAIVREAQYVRLNKYISETGVGSRREADKWIEAGRVTCNGELAVLGTRVSDGDEVRVDGKLVGVKKRQIYLALNKPVGITCTTEAH